MQGERLDILYQGFNVELRKGSSPKTRPRVVPELAQVRRDDAGTLVIKKARIDCELFGHAFAPDHLLDGTVRHPATRSSVVNAARDVGYIDEEGAKGKLKRYPCARAVKS